MTVFATCEKHPGAVVVYDNIDECPVCKMKDAITTEVDSFGAYCDRMENIREAIEEI